MKKSICALPLQHEQSPLLAACLKGYTETAQLLINKGADVNKCGQVSNDNNEIVNLAWPSILE